MSFLGSHGYHAISMDHSGSDIPATHGPWHKFKIVNVDDPAAQVALARDGYCVFPNASNAQGPKGEKRPADVIGNAVKVMRIATGEEEDVVTPASAGATLGKLGGQARARNMTPERRAEIARKAAATRWRKD